MREYSIGDWIIINGQLVKYDGIMEVNPDVRLATREEIIEGLKSSIIPFNDENFSRFLNKRMYFFVNSKLSSIQKGIQAGHAAVRYAVSYHNKAQEFLNKDETWIILDGGTSNYYNSNIKEAGEMENISYKLEQINYPFVFFHEPDLNNCLTAICLIADERVFNLEDFPVFIDWVFKHYSGVNISLKEVKEKLYEEYTKFYGKEIVTLKELLNFRKLAM